MQPEAAAYETPERRLDSTTSMVAQDSDPLPTQPSFTGTSAASHGRPFDADIWKVGMCYITCYIPPWLYNTWPYVI